MSISTGTSGTMIMAFNIARYPPHEKEHAPAYDRESQRNSIPLYPFSSRNVIIWNPWVPIPTLG